MKQMIRARSIATLRPRKQMTIELTEAEIDARQRQHELELFNSYVDSIVFPTETLIKKLDSDITSSTILDSNNSQKSLIRANKFSSRTKRHDIRRNFKQAILPSPNLPSNS